MVVERCHNWEHEQAIQKAGRGLSLLGLRNLMATSCMMRLLKRMARQRSWPSCGCTRSRSFAISARHSNSETSDFGQVNVLPLLMRRSAGVIPAGATDAGGSFASV